MGVEWDGYSERGMVNALCYDILSRSDVSQVEAFLTWFDFSHMENRPCFTGIESARLIVEQSFSEFGDLDLLILLKHKPPFGDGRAPAKQAVLIEAKVSTDTNSWQSIGDRFDEFLKMVDQGEGSKSNLFVQLHRKVRLVDLLTNEGRTFVTDQFTPRGSLGANRVVGRAKQVLVVPLKIGQTCRVALLEHTDPDFFWTTEAVPTVGIKPCPEPISGHVQPTLPVKGLSYAWVDRRDRLPPSKKPHPPEMPSETPVVVVEPSWLTTRVRQVGDPQGSRGFLVYTHHLRRSPAS